MASIAAVWSCHFFFLKFLFFSFSHVVIIILLKKLSLTTYSYMPKNISVLIYGAIKNAILRLKKSSYKKCNSRYWVSTNCLIKSLNLECMPNLTVCGKQMRVCEYFHIELHSSWDGESIRVSIVRNKIEHKYQVFIEGKYSSTVSDMRYPIAHKKSSNQSFESLIPSTVQK